MIKIWKGLALTPSSRARFELRPAKERAKDIIEGAKHLYHTLKK